MFPVTNTDAVITLNDVKIVNEDSEKILLSVCAAGWSGGKNIATLKASKQPLAGAIKVGNDSKGRERFDRSRNRLGDPGQHKYLDAQRGQLCEFL